MTGTVIDRRPGGFGVIAADAATAPARLFAREGQRVRFDQSPVALSPRAERELDAFDAVRKGVRRSSHHPASDHSAAVALSSDYSAAVALFIRLFEGRERVHPDDVERWASGRGWGEADARDLGRMADTIEHTLRALGRV
jgi:hypothetical protein